MGGTNWLSHSSRPKAGAVAIKTEITIESRNKTRLKEALLEIVRVVESEENSEDMDYSHDLTNHSPPFKFHLNNTPVV